MKDYDNITKKSGYVAKCPYCGEKMPSGLYTNQITVYETKEVAKSYLDSHIIQCYNNPESKKCATCLSYINANKLRSRYYLDDKGQDNKIDSQRVCPIKNAPVYGFDSCFEHSERRKQ